MHPGGSSDRTNDGYVYAFAKPAPGVVDLNRQAWIRVPASSTLAARRRSLRRSKVEPGFVWRLHNAAGEGTLKELTLHRVRP